LPSCNWEKRHAEVAESSVHVPWVHPQADFKFPDRIVPPIRPQKFLRLSRVAVDLLRSGGSCLCERWPRDSREQKKGGGKQDRTTSETQDLSITVL